MTELIRIMSEHKEKLKYLREQILEDIRSAPTGQLRIINKPCGPQYYLCTPEIAKTHPHGRYLKQSEKSTAVAIAQRDYGRKLLKIIEKRLRKYPDLSFLSDRELYDVYNEQSDFRKALIRPYLISDEEYLEKWISSEYRGRSFSENMPEFYSNSGIRVRSKSEKIIADYLTDRKIPYHYEKPLPLGKLTVYPDFTILDLEHRKDIYYEHFGRMDDPDYAEKAVLKLNSYEKAGFHLGDRLIATFETREHPLDFGILARILIRFSPDNQHI